MRHGREVVADGAIETDPQRVTDQRVADRHLVEMRQRPEQRQVLQIEIVAGVDAEAERVRELGGRDVARERLRGARRRPLEGACERLGVELDAIGAEARGPSHGRLLGIDEQADADAGRLKPA